MSCLHIQEFHSLMLKHFPSITDRKKFIYFVVLKLGYISIENQQTRT